MQTIRRSIIFLLIILIRFGTSYANESSETADSANKIVNKKNAGLSERLRRFYPLSTDVSYYVSVCADLPDNNNPDCVYKKKQPGHVFFIAEKRNALTGAVLLSQSFGFYPHRPASSIFFKNVRSEIHDNSNREYNVSLELKMSGEEFRLFLESCQTLSKKKYNLNKYNCYDYVIEVFNSLPRIEKLPVTHVKFPFICGRGGSPCSLYRDLEKMVSNGSSLAPFIKFGVFRSPDNAAAAAIAASF